MCWRTWYITHFPGFFCNYLWEINFTYMRRQGYWMSVMVVICPGIWRGNDYKIHLLSTWTMLGTTRIIDWLCFFFASLYSWPQSLQHDGQFTIFQCTSRIWGGNCVSYLVTINLWTWKMFFRMWKRGHSLPVKETGIRKGDFGVIILAKGKNCSECAPLAGERALLVDIHSVEALNAHMALRVPPNSWLWSHFVQASLSSYILWPSQWFLTKATRIFFFYIFYISNHYNTYRGGAVIFIDEVMEIWSYLKFPQGETARKGPSQGVKHRELFVVSLVFNSLPVLCHVLQFMKHPFYMV